MNTFRPAQYLALLLLPLAAIAACTGGDDREALTLDVYFPRIETLFGEFEGRSDAVGERFSAQLDGGGGSLSEAMEHALTFLPELITEMQPIARDLVEGLDAIEPPAATAEAHAELVAGYRELLTLFDELADQLESGEADATAAFAALTDDASATEMGQRISLAITELETVAEANAIAVDLSAAGFGGSGQAPAEPVVVPRRIPVQPAAGIATWPAGTKTGVEVINRVVASAVAGDPATLARLVHYRTVPCVLPGDAREGQLQCAEDEAAGTPIEVMLAAQCEGFFLRPAQVEPWLEGVAAEELRLHGAYVEAAARTAGRTGTTERAYVAVLAPRSEATTTVTLIVDDGGLSAVFRSCGDAPLEVPEGGLIPHGAEILLAAPE